LSLYQHLSKSLEPILGDRARVVLEEGVRRLGVSPDKLNAPQAETILKRLVYRELQSKMSPHAARNRIEEILQELGIGGQKPSKPAESARTKGVLADFEAGLKRFSLYLDWPEVGRLRGIVQVIKQSPEAPALQPLLREGQEVLAQLEEKLQAALLRQTRDIAELEMSLQRVQSVGGPKVRRLEKLIRLIQEAHAQETLAVAEVEQARALAAEMRKLVESSVVQSSAGEATITFDTIEDIPQANTPTEPQVVLKDPTVEAAGQATDGFDDESLVIDLDFEALTAEQLSRIREIDVAEDDRRLKSLKERYAALLSQPHLASQLADLEAQLAGGNPLGERLDAFAELLKAAHAEALAEARVRYEWLADRLGRLELPSGRTAPLQARLAVVLETLHAGGIPPELAELERNLESLEAEERANRENRERQARLAAALGALRTEAELALSSFRGEARVESFLTALAAPDISESALTTLRQELSELLSQLAKEREEESLKRMGLRATLQALPSLEALEPERKNLMQRLEQGAGRLAELEPAVQALVERARGLVSSRLEALEARILELERILKESLIELKQPLQASREALMQGRVPDPALLERALDDLVAARRASITEELSRYEMVARSMKGLGGEELEEKVAQARACLQAGELPDLGEIHALLGRLRRTQESLRNELSARIGTLLEDYEAHKGVGGETALRLKPLSDFLRSAAERLPRLGVSGLLEVRRALEEAERLGAQLAQEYAAAQSVLQELKGADLESLLEVFEVSPQPEPAQPAQAPSAAPSDQPEVLRQFHMRGVEAVALVEAGRATVGSLPFAASSAQTIFDDLLNLANELSGQSARLSVITLPQWVLVLVPLKQKGLVILAEKALLSRLLLLIERHRDELEAL
jgi:hypothetical protein